MENVDNSQNLVKTSIDGVMSDNAKSNLIMTHEIGSRVVPVLGDPVPENCKDGFGTWEAPKKECTLCVYSAMCFCRKTDTRPEILTESKLVRRKKSTEKSKDTMKTQESELETKSIDNETSSSHKKTAEDKKFNPFKRGSGKRVFHDFLLELGRRGISHGTDEELYALAKEWKFELDPAKKPFICNSAWFYDAKRHEFKPYNETYKDIWGFINFDYTKQTYGIDASTGNTYNIDVAKIRAFLGLPVEVTNEQTT
jgi:hypothetical protein